jgi:copper(I)-binding protein
LRHRAALAALLALLCCAAHAQAPALSAREAWVRATPGSDVAAAYVTLHNGGPQPIVITGVRSARAAQAMIHESSIVGGQSRMRPRERLRIGAGETLRLAPGGLHVMLHGLTRPLTAGEEVPLVLLLEGGASVAVTARVRALGED